MTLEEVGTLAIDMAVRKGRNDKVELLLEAFERLEANERAIFVQLFSGQVPGGKIGVGPAAVAKLVAAKPSPTLSAQLELAELAEELGRVARLQGAGSQTARQESLLRILARTGPSGQEFLLDLLGGGLRVGALAGVVEVAVAKVASVDPALLRRAVTLSGSLAKAAAVAVEAGEEGLRGFRVEIFRPLAPMLASPCQSPEEALNAWSPAMFEAKLDGVRVQAHREGSRVRIFSRHLRDITVSLPEVVTEILALPVRRIVLDGEVLSLNSEGRPRPFQETMRRLGRTAPSETQMREIPVSVFFFDLLLWDEREFYNRPLNERRDALEQVVPEPLRVQSQLISDISEAQNFFDKSIEAGFEGVMAKCPDGVYESGRRGASWLKLKPVHTLDLVVVAAEWGSGRRRGWLSNLHLAAPGENGQLVMLGKTFKGLTDEMLAWQTEELLSREVRREGGTVIVHPELVVEIAFNDVQDSPHYPGGVALRFARVRRYRTDKTADQADTLDAVKLLKPKPG